MALNAFKAPLSCVHGGYHGVSSDHPPAFHVDQGVTQLQGTSGFSGYHVFTEWKNADAVREVRVVKPMGKPIPSVTST